MCPHAPLPNAKWPNHRVQGAGLSVASPAGALPNAHAGFPLLSLTQKKADTGTLPGFAIAHANLMQPGRHIVLLLRDVAACQPFRPHPPGKACQRASDLFNEGISPLTPLSLARAAALFICVLTFRTFPHSFKLHVATQAATGVWCPLGRILASRKLSRTVNRKQG